MIRNSQVTLSDILTSINDTKEEIYSFKKLKKGWHYGEGVPFEDSTIDNAISLIEQANKLAFYATDAFPGLNGEIMCTICFGEHYLEFIIDIDGRVTFVRERKDDEVDYQEGLSLQEAKGKITEFRKEFRNKPWNIYESSTQNIITDENTDLPVLHSITPEAQRVSQLSTENVSWKQGEPPASISENIIREPERNLQSFGVFQKRLYPASAS